MHTKSQTPCKYQYFLFLAVMLSWTADILCCVVVNALGCGKESCLHYVCFWLSVSLCYCLCISVCMCVCVCMCEVMKGDPNTVYETTKDNVFFLTIKIIEASPATTLFGDWLYLCLFSPAKPTQTHTHAHTHTCMHTHTHAETHTRTHTPVSGRFPREPESASWSLHFLTAFIPKLCFLSSATYHSLYDK